MTTNGLSDELSINHADINETTKADGFLTEMFTPRHEEKLSSSSHNKG